MRDITKKCSIFLLTLLLIVQIPVLTSASEIVTDTGNYTVFTEDNESDETADIVKEYCKGASTKMSFRGKLTQVYCPKKSTTYIYRVKKYAIERKNYKSEQFKWKSGKDFNR
ncbi:hypothetical protein [Roseburia intestinalis]|uniref:hypothetical protein n=1 Tax=Roseburia intestinalis TaxID=166486 RepID=UPI0001CD893A|nr:hypothetical protein [Roseburia intestinalis]CBL08260.1 hypothetical protein ROI_10630 [Roseburia intestinalis M50/1]